MQQEISPKEEPKQDDWLIKLKAMTAHYNVPDEIEEQQQPEKAKSAGFSSLL